MLETLLESNSKTSRSIAGAITSVAAHTALIVAAVYATAQAPVGTYQRQGDSGPRLYSARDCAGSSYIGSEPRQTRPIAHRLAFVAPNLSNLSIDVPSIDARGIVASLTTFRHLSWRRHTRRRGRWRGRCGRCAVSSRTGGKAVALVPGGRRHVIRRFCGARASKAR